MLMMTGYDETNSHKTPQLCNPDDYCGIIDEEISELSDLELRWRNSLKSIAQPNLDRKVLSPILEETGTRIILSDGSVQEGNFVFNRSIMEGVSAQTAIIETSHNDSPILDCSIVGKGDYLELNNRERMIVAKK